MQPSAQSARLHPTFLWSRARAYAPLIDVVGCLVVPILLFPS
jgi:hypothetical protein